MIKEEIQNSEQILSNFSGSESAEYQKILNKISPKKVENLHSLAYIYYQNRYYKEADALFRLLIAIHPNEFEYWKGLAACLQMKKNYEGALSCYQNAQNLLKEQTDPYLYVHLADCHFAMKQIDQAFKMLELAKKRAKETHENKIIQHVTFMHERWKRNK